MPAVLEEYLDEVQSALDFLAHDAGEQTAPRGAHSRNRPGRQGLVCRQGIALDPFHPNPPPAPLAIELPLDHKISFFKELRHAYGRTALVLSGGGSFGFFHMGGARGDHAGARGLGFAWHGSRPAGHGSSSRPVLCAIAWAVPRDKGAFHDAAGRTANTMTQPPPPRSPHTVIRALFTTNLLPRIVSGSSAGALSAWGLRGGVVTVVGSGGGRWMACVGWAGGCCDSPGESCPCTHMTGSAAWVHGDGT